MQSLEKFNLPVQEKCLCSKVLYRIFNLVGLKMVHPKMNEPLSVPLENRKWFWRCLFSNFLFCLLKTLNFKLLLLFNCKPRSAGRGSCSMKCELILLSNVEVNLVDFFWFSWSLLFKLCPSNKYIYVILRRHCRWWWSCYFTTELQHCCVLRAPSMPHSPLITCCGPLAELISLYPIQCSSSNVFQTADWAPGLPVHCCTWSLAR